MSERTVESNASTILMRSGKGGTSRVFLVQTRNRAEAGQVCQIFEELDHRCSVRVLSEGVTSAFAVQCSGDEPLLQDLESLLKEHYKFSMVYSGFNSVIHRIVEDLAVETGSRLHPVPVCRSCGDAEPFPVQLTLRGPDGKLRASSVFCPRCLSAAEAEGGDASLEQLIDSSVRDVRRKSPPPVVRRRMLMRTGHSRRARRTGRTEAEAARENAPEAHPALDRLAS